MKFTYKAYNLQLKHTFTIATYSRTFTPIVLVELIYENFIGYGEASMPPYLGESHESALAFLSKIDLSTFTDPLSDYEKIISYINSVAEGNMAAKAAVDIALHDLIGKIANKPLWHYWNIDARQMPETSCTIGIDTPDVIRTKVAEAESFYILKVKLGSSNDKGLIETIRTCTSKPLYIDANQGWKNVKEAIAFSRWLYDQGALLIEQPFDKYDLESHRQLKEKQILPIIADESFQRLTDLPKLQDAFDGVNIKLMKCGGLYEARKIISEARNLNLQLMFGCMSETSCAIQAAATLAPLCDYIDLDGPYLVSNNPFVTTPLVDGKIQLSNEPGLGLKKQN